MYVGLLPGPENADLGRSKFNSTGIVSGPSKPLFKVNVEDNERRHRFAVSRDGERLLVIVKEKVRLATNLM